MPYLNDTEKIFLGVFDLSYVDRHDHDFLELVYVVEGKAAHTMNNEEVIIKKGDYFIIDYSTEHGYAQIGDEPLKIINCLFLPDFVDKTLKKCRKFVQVTENYLINRSFEKNGVNTANRIFFDENGEIFALIDKMLREYGEKREGYIEILRCLLIEIIVNITRKVSSERIITYDTPEKYLREYVNDNYMKKITLKEIASELNYSVPYLSNLFSKKYGVTFEKYLRKVRMEQSCRLLANTDKKVIEIAECVGYGDLSFFSEIFKQFTGLSPREYRRVYK